MTPARPAPALILAALAACSASGQRQAPRVPDLTREPIPNGAVHDWNLGATGARGWMYSHAMVTTGARQIAVTQVAQGSPAASVLAVGDVLLGVAGMPFGYDPRTEFGKALTLAESEQGGGVLTVTRWRAGTLADVRIELPVLGSYGDTAPYGCAKSERILRDGCAALAERMAQPGYEPNPIPRSLDALALLAGGDRRHLDLVRREARWAAGFSAKSFQTWYYGYAMMLLAEYQLATGDDQFEPGLRRLALEAANGQSLVGSWGHRFAGPDGRLFGYGMMNAPGVPLTIALVMAREAGIDDPAVHRAIDSSAKLLRFYAGKGAIPYGDHHPWIQTHEDNGKCGMGAVLFDLLGERGVAAYFSQMSLSSHGPERDGGHTGNYFNLLWAMPGVARSGPQATGAWMAEYGAWYFDLARRHDGTFAHQGPPAQGNDKYRDWDATGAYLLAYAMPRRAILLTGRPFGSDDREIEPLTARAAAARIADGRGWNNLDRNGFYDALSDRELLARLDSASPVVRERAAIAVGRRKLDCTPQLIARLESGSIASRYGACQALAQMGGRGADAIPALREALASKDLWLRIKAADALAGLGRAARGAVPDLLAALARPISNDDPRGMEQRYLCFALFDRRSGLLRHALDSTDPEALAAAIRAGLRNEDGRARSAVATVFDRLPLDQLRPLLPAILEAVRVPSPSGVMFADGVRMDGLRVLAKHRVREGIEASARYVREQKQHGSQKRVPQVLDILESYGAHAQQMIGELERTADFFEHDETDFPKKLSRQKAAAVRAALERIRAADVYPDLTSIK